MNILFKVFKLLDKYLHRFNQNITILFAFKMIMDNILFKINIGSVNSSLRKEKFHLY